MPEIETRAGTLAFRDSGRGPVLVALHATLHDHRDFDAVLPASNAIIVSSPWTGLAVGTLRLRARPAGSAPRYSPTGSRTSWTIWVSPRRY